MIAIRGHFDGRVIVLDEPADLPMDRPLLVHVEPAPDGQTPAPPREPAVSVFEWIRDNAIDDPSLPTDLAHQHDHYLYGTPKKQP